MSNADRPPDVRPVFRKLALGVALFCFVAAGAFGLFGDGDLTGPIICLAVGGMMTVIGATGYWPPRR